MGSYIYAMTSMRYCSHQPLSVERLSVNIAIQMYLLFTAGVPCGVVVK